MTRNGAQTKFNLDEIYQARMMPEEAWNNSSSFIDETFNWMHSNSTPWLGVSALVMQVVAVAVHPLANVRNVFCVPFVHESVNPVEVTISPGWNEEDPAEQGQLTLSPIEEVVLEIAKRVHIHGPNFNDCSHENGTKAVWDFSPHMLFSWVVFVELHCSDGFSIV